MTGQGNTPACAARLAVLLISAALAAGGGCARTAATGLLPGFEPARLLGVEHAPEPTAAKALETLMPGVRTFARIEGGAVAALDTMTIDSAGDGAWRCTIDGQRASLVRFDGEQLLLVETIDFPNRAATTFDPPVPLTSQEAANDAELNTRHHAIVRSLGDEARIIDRGTAEQVLRREQDQDLRLPGGGVFRAARFTREFSLALRRAHVMERTTSWYAANLGLAAEQSLEEVRVLGPLGWRKERLVVRVP